MMFLNAIRKKIRGKFTTDEESDPHLSSYGLHPSKRRGVGALVLVDWFIPW